METAIFNRYVNDPSSQEHELLAREGQTVKVLGQLPESEYDQPEVGAMYMIQFEDGLVVDAFADELTWN